MENHIHMVASASGINRSIQRFKSYTARQIIDELTRSHQRNILHQLKFYRVQHRSQQEYQFWNESSHPVMMQSERMLYEKILYIHNNPVRRGYVEDPIHWRHSSARDYTGIAGDVPVTIIV
jgi:hypothetical protein